MRIVITTLVFCLASTALAAEDSVFPKQYLEQQEYFAGQWSGAGKIGDDDAKITCQARWAPGKHCLMFQGITRRKGQEPFKWTILSGCDTHTGEMVDYYFATDGSSCVTRWKTVSKTEQVGTETGIDEGKPYSRECKAVTRDADTWTFSTTTIAGKPVKIEYKRVKGEKK